MGKKICCRSRDRWIGGSESITVEVRLGGLGKTDCLARQFGLVLVGPGIVRHHRPRPRPARPRAPAQPSRSTISPSDLSRPRSTLPAR